MRIATYSVDYVDSDTDSVIADTGLDKQVDLFIKGNMHHKQYAVWNYSFMALELFRLDHFMALKP